MNILPGQKKCVTYGEYEYDDGDDDPLIGDPHLQARCISQLQPTGVFGQIGVDRSLVRSITGILITSSSVSVRRYNLSSTGT